MSVDLLHLFFLFVCVCFSFFVIGFWFGDWRGIALCAEDISHRVRSTTESTEKDRMFLTVLFVGVLVSLSLFIGPACWPRILMALQRAVTPRLFHHCCILCMVVALFNGGYYLMFQQDNEGHLWIARLCDLILLLLVFVMHGILSQTITATIVFVAMTSAWAIPALQFADVSRNPFVLVFDCVFAVTLTIGFLSLVDWNWIMVNHISSTFTNDSLENYDNLFNLQDALPLSNELDVTVSVREVPLDRRCSIPSAFCKRWGPTYVLLAFIRLLYDFGGLLPAYFLRQLVDNLVQGEDIKNNSGSRGNIKGGIWPSAYFVLAIILCTITVTFLRIHYNLKLQRMALYNRGLLSAELYRFTLCRRKHQFGGKDIGDVINHLSVDVQRVGDAAQTLYDLWALPVQLIFALYLLYIQVSFAFLAGVVITLLLIPINGMLAKRMKRVQAGLMEENDERVSTITEIINNIAYIKMCGWSSLAQKWVHSPRLRYMQHLRWLKYLDAFCVFFWAATPILVSLFTFMTFIWIGGHLTPGKAVSALSLFGSLILPLNAFPWVINGFLEAYVSWQRLQPFLVTPTSDNEYFVATSSYQHLPFESEDIIYDRVYGATSGDTNGMGSENIYSPVETNPDKKELLNYEHSLNTATHLTRVNRTPKKNTDMLFNIQQCLVSLEVVGYRRRDEHTNNTVNNSEVHVSVPSFELRIPTFQASRGKLIAIVGPSGSGKSTFLSAIAGELKLSGSSMCTTKHSVAYVEQQPFLMGGSLQENILFGSPYNDESYRSALNAVVLSDDVQLLPDGDKSIVGSRGDRLSGGQRVRVALARALYANCEVWLVDDIFGSLDATVAHHVVSKAIVPAASRDRRCVIVATHNEEIIHCADAVYQCIDGELTQINKAAGLPRSLSTYSAVGSHMRKGVNTDEEVEKNGRMALETTVEAGKKLMSSSIEVSERGALAWATVTCYLSHVGWGLLAVIIGFAALMQAARNASDQFIVMWSKDGDGNTNFFLRVLGVLTAVNSVLALCRGFSFALGGLQAAQRLHDDLLAHVLSATYTFFTNTSPGRIITRLSTDVYAIDESLPFAANILLAQFFLLLGSVVVILINSTMIIALSMILIVVLYYKVQWPYRQLARELRRLDGATRAPLLDNLRIAFDGGVVIRSFGLKAISDHLSKSNEDIRVSMRVQYNTILLNAWFSLRLELIGVLLLMIVGIFAVVPHGGSSSALFGLALAYVQPLTSYASGLLGAFTSTEKELISVERVRQFFQLETESEVTNITANKQEEEMIEIITEKWPSRGVVEFRNVSVRYDAHGPLVLNHLSFSVVAGERVALVGRTGAGKSSIFAALLRLIPMVTGHIFIDDKDLSQLSLSFLRSHLGILPQHPFVFHGTLRTNIDPFARHSDHDILSVMELVGLSALDLNLCIAAGGEGLSEGQRHKVGLARVLLQRSHVMLLDEPSSQASSEAEATLWKVLNRHLHGTTVLCITHKMKHIDFFDRVLVIEKGSVVANGTPTHLRQNNIWPFYMNEQDPEYAVI